MEDGNYRRGIKGDYERANFVSMLDGSLFRILCSDRIYADGKR